MVWGKFAAVAITLALSAGAAWAADLPAVAIPTGPAPSVPSLADPTFFLHVGPVGIFPSEKAKITVYPFGIPTFVAGGTISIDPHYTVNVEAGYYFAHGWAVAFSGGLPPKIDINGAGTVAGVGKFGSVVYGPSALLLQSHFLDWGMIKPYVGAGPVYMPVFDNSDGAITNLKVNSAFGAAAQIGADIMFNRNWGIYIDVKKAYLRTKAKGLAPLPFPGTPMTADVTLDPLTVSAGVTYTF